MGKKSGISWNPLKTLFFAALLLSVTLAVNTASASEYPPEGGSIPPRMSGSVEMLPIPAGQQMPPQNVTPPPTGASPPNGAPPQSDGTQPPNRTGEHEAAPAQPENGAPPQQFGGALPPPPVSIDTSAPNSSSFGSVPVDGKMWGILIFESIILALGIAFASLYKKERL